MDAPLPLLSDQVFETQFFNSILHNNCYRQGRIKIASKRWDIDINLQLKLILNWLFFFQNIWQYFSVPLNMKLCSFTCFWTSFVHYITILCTKKCSHNKCCTLSTKKHIDVINFFNRFIHHYVYKIYMQCRYYKV
jgi:hypothetical protein